MPHYTYRCETCEEEQELFHPMAEIVVNCGLCGATESMKKVLKFRKNRKIKNKTGQLVKDFIQSAKEETEIEKIRLAKREKS